MLPSYSAGQLVIIDKRDLDIDRGDVIVFRCENVKGLIVKRTAGIPGDRIVIKDGKLYVNGQPCDTYPYIEHAGNAEEELLLGENEYFVLGDNVSESRDSRYDEIGIVSAKNIYGKILNSR